MDHQQRRKDRAEATRRSILSAAARLTREGGFDRLTVRDVCAAAGVTTGAFYHHFRSKDDLLTQGFSSLDDYLESAMADAPVDDPAGRLERLLRSYARYMEDMGWQTLSLYYSRRIADPTAAFTMAPNRYTLQTMRSCFQELARRGDLAPAFPPEWTAEFCFRHFRGLVVDWILHQGSYPLWAKLERDYQLLDRAFRA